MLPKKKETHSWDLKTRYKGHGINLNTETLIYVIYVKKKGCWLRENAIQKAMELTMKLIKEEKKRKKDKRKIEGLKAWRLEADL